jgi:threonine synthase
MKYISTSGTLSKVGFKEAVQLGIPLEGGLFVPETIPQFDAGVLADVSSLSLHDLAFSILLPYVEEEFSETQLRSIIDHTFSFDIPIRRIGDTDIQVLELFHGPTWAFKDVGARFLAGCLAQWNDPSSRTVILVATSGDTGGAVANGFFNQPGIDVLVLYPKGKISTLQEMQIAGLGGNITALEIDGSFDDCQRMVKSAFNDTALRSEINITSANSINIARWLPQMVFYAIIWKSMHGSRHKDTVCIPSGNYGNLAAAFLLHDMGMHFSKILAAHNANDTIPTFLRTGKFSPSDTVATLANAMDVSDPSNFVRLQYLQQHQYRGRMAEFNALSVSDEQILESIRDVWHQHQYLLDPHTATAWHMLKAHGGGTIVATAHPYKFEGVIVKALGFYPTEWIKTWESGSVHSISVPADYSELKEILLKVG